MTLTTTNDTYSIGLNNPLEINPSPNPVGWGRFAPTTATEISPLRG